MVVQQDYRWTTAFSFDQGELHIPHNTCQHENRRDIEVAAANALYDLVGHRVENVAHDGDAAQDSNALVKEIHIVSCNVLPCLDTRSFIDGYIVAAFCHYQKQCEQKRDEHNPMGKDDARSQTANYDAQHKSRSNDEYIEKGNLFKFQAVGNVHEDVEQQRTYYPILHNTTIKTPQDNQCDGHYPYCAHSRVGGPLADCTASYWSQALHWMLAVGFCIVNVIEAVDAAGGQTEGCESHYAGPYVVPVGGVPVEKQRCEDNEVLQPLMWTYQCDDVSIHVSSALDRELMTDARRSSFARLPWQGRKNGL